jgi:2-dehydro-3-deoxyphosphogluconate aldolase/(4S)-4-hydroxy-2-oxoglutarate aldolase
MTNAVAQAIAQSRLVGIVRESTADAARTEVRRLVDAGTRAIEVSLSTPAALSVVEWMSRDIAGGDVHVGVGTVLSADQVDRAAEAGAEFIVSPISSAELLAATAAHGLVSVVGCMTPTECFEAASHGADFVKLFPASMWNTGSMRDLLQALPALRLVPTGGVTVANAMEWLDAGAAAVGAGGALRRLSDPRQLADFIRGLAGDQRQHSA